MFLTPRIIRAECTAFAISPRNSASCWHCPPHQRKGTPAGLGHIGSQLMCGCSDSRVEGTLSLSKALIVQLMPTFKGFLPDDDLEDLECLDLRLESTRMTIIPRLAHILKAGDRYESRLGYTFTSAAVRRPRPVRNHYLGICVAIVPQYGVRLFQVSHSEWALRVFICLTDSESLLLYPS